MIKDIRTKLNVPDLPVIIPMIDAQGQWTNNSIVRAAEIAVTKKLKNVDTLDTKGFPTDGTHYRGQGQVKIGTITAQRWLNMNFQYGPNMVIYNNLPMFEQLQPAQLSKNVLFDLSGRRIGAVDGEFDRLVPYNGVLIVKMNQQGRMQVHKVQSVYR